MAGKRPDIKPVKSKEERDEARRQNGKKSRFKNHDEVYKKAPKLELEPQANYSLADLSADIYDPRAQIAPEIKMQGAMCYLMTGTVKGAEKLSGIDKRTISNWKTHAQWWPVVLEKLRAEKQDELDGQFTGLIHEYTDALRDRLEKGDEVIVRTKYGVEKHRKKVTTKEAAAVLATLFDKRAALRGDPTNFTAKAQSSDDIRNELRQEFAAFAKEAMDAKVVSEQ